MRSRQNVSNNVQEAYTDGAAFLQHLAPEESNNLLRAESIQSMSNVVDMERDPPNLDRIQRGHGAPFINNSVQMRNNKLKFQQQQSRNQKTKQFAHTQQARSGKKGLESKRKRNIFVALLENGLLSIVMKFLPIRRALPLKSVAATQGPRKRESLPALFESEFLRYLNFYRCHDANVGGKRSMLCRLVTMYYLSTLEVTER